MFETASDSPRRPASAKPAGSRLVKIVFINRFFHPDHSATSQMLADLAFALAAAGREVHVVTSRLRYDDPAAVLPSRETLDGVAIARIWTTRFGRSNLLGRAVDYLSFYFSAAVMLWRVAGSGDIVVAKTDPPMLSLLATPIARWRRAVAVNWLQDVYPEVVEALGMAPGAFGAAAMALLRRARDRSLRRAACNVVLGDRMADRLRALGVEPARLAVIANWADGRLVRPVAPADNPLRRQWAEAAGFVVAYSGNLGRAHDIETILSAMSATARAATPVLWLFIGGGAQYDALAREARRRCLSSFRLEPYQPRDRLAESLSAADVHLVSLRPSLEGLVVPSKFYGIAAAGRATIFIGDGDGEIARELRRIDGGLTVSQGDGDGLAHAVLGLAADPQRCRRLGENSRRAFERDYDLARAVRQWQRLIDAVAPAAPS